MIRWPLALYRVEGDSMLPTYRPGDVLLGLRWARPRVGRVIVAWLEDRPIIKRVTRIEPAGVWLEGDNVAASVDSRRYGHFAADTFEAVIVVRLARG